MIRNCSRTLASPNSDEECSKVISGSRYDVCGPEVIKMCSKTMVRFFGVRLSSADTCAFYVTNNCLKFYQ